MLARATPLRRQENLPVRLQAVLGGKTYALGPYELRCGKRYRHSVRHKQLPVTAGQHDRLQRSRRIALQSEDRAISARLREVFDGRAPVYACRMSALHIYRPDMQAILVTLVRGVHDVSAVGTARQVSPPRTIRR